MNKFFHYIRGVIAGLLLLFLLFINAAAGERSEEIRLENIKPTWEDDVVVIAYDLIAPVDQKYEVRLVMRRESDRAFKFIPKTVRGDIGKGKFAGKGREIRWAYQQDAPKGFQGNDYYFVIEVKKAGSKIWLYGSLGAAALGGAVYAIIDSIDPKELPGPPARP